MQSSNTLQKVAQTDPTYVKMGVSGGGVNGSLSPNALYLQQSDFDGNGELRKTTQPTIVAGSPKHLLAVGDLLLASKGNIL